MTDSIQVQDALLKAVREEAIGTYQTADAEYDRTINFFAQDYGIGMDYALAHMIIHEYYRDGKKTSHPTRFCWPTPLRDLDSKSYLCKRISKDKSRPTSKRSIADVKATRLFPATTSAGALSHIKRPSLHTRDRNAIPLFQHINRPVRSLTQEESNFPVNTCISANSIDLSSADASNCSLMTEMPSCSVQMDQNPLLFQTIMQMVWSLFTDLCPSDLQNSEIGLMNQNLARTIALRSLRSASRLFELVLEHRLQLDQTSQYQFVHSNLKNKQVLRDIIGKQKPVSWKALLRTARMSRIFPPVVLQRTSDQLQSLFPT